ncbi:DUF3040 domain-containing protein [Actinoplanes regularis]|uniref:DUF3040 domain-containing protein n=1 Tax=Actinoplanes regularis TaxID=52697 RepID=UPI0024A463F3|nr:DUF3040 domain-containing protein [Actinoplanes regularis]GLW30117.1 hypothetical protein Areg01_30570 [Actinoplanes regularis]
MLEPREQREFDDMTARLRDTDPAFSRRVSRLPLRQRRRWLTSAILLWSIVPICLIYGGWTGALEATLVIAYGAWLLHKRRRAIDQPSWPSSTDRRPAAET